MAENPADSPHGAEQARRAATLAVRLELGDDHGPSTTFNLNQESILIGTVAGCDVRLPGAALPPLLCLLTAQAGGLHLRKLAPAQAVLVNGQPCSEALLAPDDLLTIPPFTFRVQFTLEAPLVTFRPAAESLAGPSLAEQRRLLDEGARELAESRRQLDEDRRDWEQDAERQAEALAWRSRQQLEREKELASASACLQRQEEALVLKQQELDQQEAKLNQRAVTEAHKQEALEKLRQRLHDLRASQYDRYRKRRDFLLALQEAVNRAARKVQEQKRELTAEAAQLQARGQAQEQIQAEQTAQKQRLEQVRLALVEQHRLVEEWQQELEREQAERQSRWDANEKQLEAARQQLEASQAEHRADLARLERFHATLQTRQTQLDARGRQLDDRAAQLEKEAAELHEQTQQMEDWDARLRVEAQNLALQREEGEAASRRLAGRLTGLETQQGVLASQRTRLERLHMDLLDRERQLTAQRMRQDEIDAGLRATSRQLQQQQAALQREREQWHAERQQLQGRCSGVETALAQLRELQHTFEQEQGQWQRRRAALDEAMTEMAQMTQLLRLRADRVLAMRRRVVAGRQALREHESQLVQSEQARETMQEQLRRRAEALAERERKLAEQERQLQEAVSTVQAGQVELETRRLAVDAEQSSWQQECSQREAAWVEREAALQRQSEELQANRNALEGDRQTLAQEQAQLEALRAEATANLNQVHQEAAALQEHLPQLTQHALLALDRLGKAREQLREHLGEIHLYVQECRAEFEIAQRDLAAQVEQFRQQQLAVARAQDEHRHAVSAFRQFLSEWQGQLAELRQSLAQGESILDQRQAHLEEQARRIDETSTRLSARAEQLEDLERDVTRRRDELTRHLADMQQWYRQKLRELAERRLLQMGPAPASDDEAAMGDETGFAGPTILPLRQLPAAADRQLAELLTSMALIDAETLAALLDEARKQRCSLRDALLDGEFLTPYQVELIEAGQLEALVLGPLRIVDRLRLTPLETVYRVFDPRRGAEALLRHLSPSASAEQKAEFRQRFTQACGIRDVNLAATLEVLDMDGSPAALQEWTVGVASGEWAEFAAAPAVWLRLMAQAAAGLRAAHEAGLDHGHLHAGRLLLTEQGDLKICGLGEPAWLFPEREAKPPDTPRSAPDFAADLHALGTIAEAWLLAGPRGRLRRRGDEPLQVILQRLLSPDHARRYPSAAALAEHLERVRSEAPEDGIAWQRLLTLVGDRLRPMEPAETPRQSA